jgi:hypothetical protein
MMKLKMMLFAMAMFGAAGLATAQSVPFGGSVKDFLKTAKETQSVQPVAGKPVVAAAETDPTILERAKKLRDHYPQELTLDKAIELVKANSPAVIDRAVKLKDNYPCKITLENAIIEVTHVD